MARPDEQSEFVFSDCPAPTLAPPEPLADIVADIARLWNLPLYQKILLNLKAHSLDEISGRLELVNSPDLPLNPAHPLSLRIAGVIFTCGQVAAVLRIKQRRLFSGALRRPLAPLGQIAEGGVERGVVGLGGGAGEDHFAGAGVDQHGDAAASGFDLVR